MCAVWAWGPRGMSEAPAGQLPAPQWQTQRLHSTSRPCLPQQGGLCYGERQHLQILYVCAIHMHKHAHAFHLMPNLFLIYLMCLSKVNCNDDLGILEGKWQGSYKDGVKPTEWSGSADILHRWVSSNCSPVRYGQCWVFAAVLCTGTFNNWDTRVYLCQNHGWHWSVIELQCRVQ